MDLEQMGFEQTGSAPIREADTSLGIEDGRSIDAHSPGDLPVDDEQHTGAERPDR
jgi:hypothetical protein